MTLTELNWKSGKPTVRGLYWRRNGKNDKPQLAVVFKGVHGLKVRIVTEPNRPGVRSADKPVDRPVESFTSGQWAGPLGPP
jgi:hypothetical protein